MKIKIPNDERKEFDRIFNETYWTKDHGKRIIIKKSSWFRDMVNVVIVLSVSFVSVLPVLFFVSLFQNGLIVKVVMFGFFSGMLSLTLVESTIGDYIKRERKKRGGKE